jgi:hypothetical protein
MLLVISCQDLDYTTYDALIGAEIACLRSQINEKVVRELASRLNDILQKL